MARLSGVRVVGAVLERELTNKQRELTYKRVVAGGGSFSAFGTGSPHGDLQGLELFRL